MRITLPTAALTAATAVLMAVASPARAADVFDNLDSTQDGSDPVFGYGPLADSFTSTGDAWLTGVTALLGNGSSDIVGTLRLSLRADTALHVPGVELAAIATFSSATIGAGFASYRFTPTTAVALSAGRRYWIELESLSPQAVAWSWSGDMAATGIVGEYNYSAVLGSSPNASFAPYQMAVSVTPVPEPATAWLAAFGVLSLLGTVRIRAR